MNKQEFIKCFAHFITESDLNNAFDTHFKELGHMNCYEIEQWLNDILDEWIPCSKKLPQHYTEVKLKLNNGEEAIGERGAFVDPFIAEWAWKIKHKGIITDASKIKVIAWHSL